MFPGATAKPFPSPPRGRPVNPPEGRGTARGPRPVEELLEGLASGGPTLVALSGGVDSAVTALLAHRADPGRTYAATLVGPAVSAFEADRAVRVARWIGIPHTLLPVDPLAVEGYRSNPPNRCYFCRTTETAALRRYGASLGIARYLDGVQRDDLGDVRPGIRALDEAGFEHPLLAAGWGKSEVRTWAHREGLPNWDAPSDACLASRIPHGIPVAAELLERIADSEADLRARGYGRIRVRIDGTGARIEVDPQEVARLLEPFERAEVTRRLKARGFTAVEIDPRGYGHRAHA